MGFRARTPDIFQALFSLRLSKDKASGKAELIKQISCPLEVKEDFPSILIQESFEG